jgi:hypothetical protein
MKNLKSLLITICLLFVSSKALALPENYQTLTALQKRTQLWSEIKAKPYSELPDVRSGVGIGFILSSLGTFSTLAVSFDHTSDEMPVGRRKIIHPFGTVAAVRWVPTKNHSYTGIFQSGGHGIARLSIAGDPNLLGNTFGMGLKIFVNKKPSVNLHVMHSLDGQGEDNNFFAHNFTNNIPEPTSLILKPLAALFALVQDPPTYLPVDHFARVNSKGSEVEDFNAPFSLVFKPASDVKGLFDSNSDSDSDFRDDLASLTKGTTLYQVYALRVKSDRKPLLIGSIVLDSLFVASEYADQKLFFQHHK